MSFGFQVLGFGAYPNKVLPVAASGGTVTTSGQFTIHTFNSSADFVVSTGGNVDFLVIAGGGGGGSAGGGGGRYYWWFWRRWWQFWLCGWERIGG